MISYKYNIYHSKKTKYLDKMLRECCFVWNHALALQRRYYRLFGKYIPVGKMQKHFAKRVKRILLHSQTVQEILQRLDSAYNRFFKKLSKRHLENLSLCSTTMMSIELSFKRFSNLGRLSFNPLPTGDIARKFRKIIYLTR